MQIKQNIEKISFGKTELLLLKTNIIYILKLNPECNVKKNVQYLEKSNKNETENLN